ncbi:pilus assembly protein TadG-related protein [Novosphingobium terrae]|uniref:pilus assembly protein TadG-related protein n=1 Tax=Novosphingobium terrae TaxID=2726189 RepID=UPI00197EE80F|nr:pilus assembly protein TadG-related protein [Novosphingobium terrae]
MRPSPSQRPISFFGALARDRGGNVLLIVAGVIAVLCFALGFGIDYSRAMKLQTKLNAAADAAALAAVNSVMMQSSCTSTDCPAAKTAAINMFTQQVSGLSGLVFNASTDLTVTVSPSGSLNNGRNATVTWKAKSLNIFATILGSTQLAISGSAQANATKAPYMNFYIMFDTSPSMLLPATSAGLSAIMSATASKVNSPYGCAFACHAMMPHNDSIYIQSSNTNSKNVTTTYDVFLNANYYTSGATGYQTYYQIDSSNNVVDANFNPISGYTFKSGTLKDAGGNVINGYYADGYWLTHNYPLIYTGKSAITLRIDEERNAAQALIPYAQQMATSNQVTYNMQMFGFNWTHTASGALNPVTALTSSMTNVNSLSTSSVPDLYAAQDWWYQNSQPTKGVSNNDMGTEFTNMLTTMLATMPIPGDGTTAASPQEVMFLVTDGVADESVAGVGRWHRELNAVDLTQCTAIKSKGIKIAILYTQYLPDSLTGDSWSQSNLAPYLANVSPTLQSCASVGTDGSPLFYTVTTNQSISDALVSLFALTVQQAHLTQ